MEKENIKKTLQTLRNKEAWKIVSNDMKLTPELITVNEDKIDWDELSLNSEIRWTMELVSEYQTRINWEFLSNSLFDSEEKLACTEHLKIVRCMFLRLDWNALSDSYLPTRKEYLKEFAEHWNWEKIAENDWIIWSESLFTDFEDKLLPILSAMALENLVAIEQYGDLITSRRRRRRYIGFRFDGLLKQLIEKDADKLRIQLLNQLCLQDKHTDRRSKIAIQNLCTKEIN
jgi:hypothetical protein